MAASRSEPSQRSRARAHGRGLARDKLGDMRVYYNSEQRGASNAKAKLDFDWQPMFPSWKTGFEALYSDMPRQPSQVS